MTNILDNPSQIKKIDKQNVYGSIEALPDQCMHAWEDVEKIKIPGNFVGFKNVVVCGMGGSGLGAHVIEECFKKELSVPLIRNRDYNLPGFVSKDSLIVLSSYSGSTEEIVSCAKEAVKLRLRTVAVTTGKDIEALAKKHNFPLYKINPQHNPSGQPRMAIGYSVFGQIALFAKLGLIKVKKAQVNALKASLEELSSQFEVDKPSIENLAKKTALKLKERIICLMAAEHLAGAIHVFNNQLNENSKSFSTFFSIPELNHHLMEGLKNPKSLKDNACVLLFDSQLYSKQIGERLKLTADVVKKNGLPALVIDLKFSDKLAQCFELILIGAYINFYLAILYNIDPAPIPWVDYFKAQLKK